MTFLFVALFLPVVSLLLLEGYVVATLCDKVEKLRRRCDDIECVDEPQFTGRILWPTDADEWLVEGLREEAGDEDDRKRQQLESVIRLTEQRH